MSAAAIQSSATSARLPRKLAWLGPGVLVGSLVPLARLCVLAAHGQLGADPIAIALNQLGRLALIFLIASLAATPARILFHVNWPIRVRRQLGLTAFFYACLHFLLYALVDQTLAWDAIVADVTQRKFITVGFVALLLLVPLAITSTSGMLKRMGALRWKRLHRLAYVAASLGVVHFLWRVKRDFTEPGWYAAVLVGLFAVRIWHARRKKAHERGY